MMQTAPSCTEHELVAAIRRGSDRAFEELYSRYRSRIAAYVVKMLGDHARAEDIVQEVFISALRRLQDTERPIAFKPWIYEIAKNACIDEFRRTTRGKEVPLEDHEAPSDGGRELLSGVPPLEAAIENKQRLDDLRGAFHGLSENHHRIIVMRELAGLSYDEIGQRLGISKPVVESTLFRARRRLSAEYEEIVSGRRCDRVRTVIAADGERPLRSLGLRDRRQLARHLAHCQPCRRYARMAGVDESFFQAPTLIGKIAALLPLPWLRSRRSHADDGPAASAGSHSIAPLQSVQNVAPFVDPAGPAFGLGRLAAAAAAIVITGAGGGLIAGLGPTGGGHHRQDAARTGRTATSAAHVPHPGAVHGVRAASAKTVAGGAALTGTSGRPSDRSSSRGGGRPSGGGPAGGAAGGQVAGGGSGGGAAGGGGASGASGAAGAARGAATPTSSSSGGGGATRSGSAGSLVSGVTNTAGSGLRQTTAGAGSTVGGLTSTAGKVVNGLSSHAPSAPSLPTPKLPPVSLPKLPSLPAAKVSVSAPSLPKVSLPSPDGLGSGLTHK